MSPRVILVDDETERATSVREALEANGFDVVAVLETGAGLPHQAEQLSPDVIVVDMDNPDRDTIENMRRLTHEHHRPVVMFAQNPKTQAIHARAAGQAAASSSRGWLSKKPSA